MQTELLHKTDKKSNATVNNVQKKENKADATGIPAYTKSLFESSSGFSFDDVRVHYNSDRPARLNALAYTQGSQVYIAPGQERHLNHELGHVVQQKQGRVHADKNIAGFPVNTSEALESEADNLGKTAIQRKIAVGSRQMSGEVVQLMTPNQIMLGWEGGNFTTHADFQKHHWVDANTTNIKRALIHGARGTTVRYNTTIVANTPNIKTAMSNRLNTWAPHPSKDGCWVMTTVGTANVQQTKIRTTATQPPVETVNPTPRAVPGSFAIGGGGVVTKIGDLTGGVTQADINGWVAAYRTANPMQAGANKDKRQRYNVALRSELARLYNLRLDAYDANQQTAQDTAVETWVATHMETIGNTPITPAMTRANINGIVLVAKRLKVDVASADGMMSHLETLP